MLLQGRRNVDVESTSLKFVLHFFLNRWYVYLALYDNNTKCGMCDLLFDSSTPDIGECFRVSSERGGMSGGRTIFFMIYIFAPYCHGNICKKMYISKANIGSWSWERQRMYVWIYLGIQQVQPCMMVYNRKIYIGLLDPPIPKHLPTQTLTRNYHQNVATHIKKKKDSCHPLIGSEMRWIIYMMLLW